MLISTSRREGGNVSQLATNCIGVTIILCCLAVKVTAHEVANGAEASDAVALWLQIGREAGLTDEVIASMRPTVARAFAISPHPARFTDDPKLQESVKGWLARYQTKLRPGAADADGYTNWHAWLIHHACSRAAASDEDIRRVREQIASALRQMRETVPRDLRGLLRNYDEYAMIVNDGLDQVETEVMRRVAVLQSDPLFPALRTPLTADQINRFLKNGRNYPSFRPPTALLVSERQTYTKRLRNFFNDRPTMMLHPLVCDQTFPILSKSHPFGLPHSVSTASSETWPMDVRMYVPNLRTGGSND